MLDAAWHVACCELDKGDDCKPSQNSRTIFRTKCIIPVWTRASKLNAVLLEWGLTHSTRGRAHYQDRLSIYNVNLTVP